MVATVQSMPCRAQVLTGMFSTTSGKIDDRWQRFMKFQIARTRGYFADAEGGIDHLDADARWPVWSALILYRCHVPSHAAVPWSHAPWLTIPCRLPSSRGC